VDKAKLRLLAGAGGVLFGFAGIVTLAVALVIAVSTVIGMVAATIFASCIFLCIACLCAFFFLQPHKSAHEEIDQLESATADALADLPFDTVKALFTRHPIATIAVSLGVGYLFVRDPDMTLRNARRLLMLKGLT
jgi:hypothetical protein